MWEQRAEGKILSKWGALRKRLVVIDYGVNFARDRSTERILAAQSENRRIGKDEDTKVSDGHNDQGGSMEADVSLIQKNEFNVNDFMDKVRRVGKE